ncbi:hypothetical protein RJ640_029055 [Escallonia rubra]|uniref:Uncharacterized protein n=1 Tax=Escallonia rubra TaxID=112253 RepID=A0AA88S3G2_9ASTE|nr:hypothetical protein RJ640_029055 [Escallonia rubra]
MGATIPARIQPGSIDHVPFRTVVLCLGASLALREKGKLAVEFFLFPSRVILRCVHRRGNRNPSCSAGVAWSESESGVRSLTSVPRQHLEVHLVVLHETRDIPHSMA